MKRENARNYGREVKGYIVANGMTLTGMAVQLSEKYGWSSCIRYHIIIILYGTDL